MKKAENYVITPEKFFDKHERHQLLKTCAEQAELDLLHGRKAWVTRRALIYLALFSGLRVQEIANLEIADIHLKKDESYIVVHHGKRNKTRTVWIDNKLASYLKKYIHWKKTTAQESVSPDAPLFAGREGKHVPINTLQKSFKTAIKKAEIGRASCRERV